MKRALALLLCASAACGGGEKKTTTKPKGSTTTTKTKQVAPPETEADREKKRKDMALALVPDGSNCLPTVLKEDGAPRLELAAIGTDAVLCAVDTDPKRLLGPVGCWKIDLAEGTLAYQQPAPLPGRGLDVTLDDRCARGFCLPKEVKLPDVKVAHMAWNLDGTKVAVLVGDDVHLFDGASKAHESTFNIRGDKGVTNDPTAIHFIGDAIVVEGADQGPYSAVWVYKIDGTHVGPVTAIGAKDDKPVSSYGGSVSILDKTRIGVAEKGMEVMHTFDLTNGARAKLVRRITKPPCKADEIDAYWHEGDKVSDKCRESMDKQYAHLKGAIAVMGSKSMLVLLRGDRLGELGVLDAKTLAEKKAIKLPWCEAGGAVAQPEKKGGKGAEE